MEHPRTDSERGGNGDARMNDVYLVATNGTTIKSVTICDDAIADTSARQLRSRGRKVKVFHDRESYLKYLKEYNG